MATLYSKTFYGSVVLNGTDQLVNLSGDSGVTYSTFATPWESVPINIVGISLIAFDVQPGYMMVGNSYSPDIMAAGAKTSTVQVFYPYLTSFPFPAAGTVNPPHLDVHVNGCGVVGNFQCFLYVFYTK